MIKKLRKNRQNVVLVSVIDMLNSRRTFLKASFLSSAVLIMSGCNVFGAVSPSQTLDLVQTDLFPFANELGVNLSAYLTIVQQHSRISDEDKQFLRNGVQWLNEEAVLKYDRVYSKLNSKQRQSVLKIISGENWGESWISALLTYTMEAIFSDKVYGVNSEEKAHKWLEFSMGEPRPTKALL